MYKNESQNFCPDGMISGVFQEKKVLKHQYLSYILEFHLKKKQNLFTVHHMQRLSYFLV